MQQSLIDAFQHVSHSPVDYPLRPSTPRPPHISRNSQTHSPESLSDDTDWVSVLEQVINDELSSDDYDQEEDRTGAVGPDRALSQNNTKPTLPSLTVPVTPIRIPSPPLDDHNDEHTNESLFDTEGEDLHEDDDDSALPDDHWSTHHHGLSRLAFAHRKKFWSFRAEEYHRIEIEQHHPLHHTELGFLSAEDGDKDDEDPSNEEAYDAFFEWSSSPPTSPTSSFPTSPTISPTTSPTATQNDDDDNDTHSPPPASIRDWQPGCFIPQVPIYPRMGDLLQLRDERASLMDKAFNTFSLNTLAKILYLHDMLDRSEGRSAREGTKVEDTGGDTDIETQECSAERSLSPVSSNDDTLVDEDVSGDGSGDEEKTTFGDSSVSATTSASATRREWETDWYARWQILVRKFGIDEMMKAVEAASYSDEEIGSDSSTRYEHDFGEDESDVEEEMRGRRDLRKELEDAEGGKDFTSLTHAFPTYMSSY